MGSKNKRKESKGKNRNSSWYQRGNEAARMTLHTYRSQGMQRFLSVTELCLSR